MHPSICPLCRKAFSPERAKKIITGEGESDSTKKGIELMEKLIGSWDMDTEDEQLVVLTLEVQAWLDAGNTVSTLMFRFRGLSSYIENLPERAFNSSTRRFESVPHTQEGTA